MWTVKRDPGATHGRREIKSPIDTIHLTPFLSLLLIAVSVGERISPRTAAGRVMVIAGIVLERGLGRVGVVVGRG
ncbi:MAG: hypothetical protein AVO35_12600 [Candidatus Aegiribacteria sp. MLS_C]|nr:MAG: hypothetical protein AVO35_12600 [Candidatus Aegiribacteria sp. MLS_C]